jgi:hypothetical protein
VIGKAIADEIGRPVSYREAETDGARRPVGRLAELLQSRRPRVELEGPHN